MSNNKASLYSSALGRFLQIDPIGYQDDMNLYAYVGNDPLNRTDPTGENKEAIQALRGILSAPNPYTVAIIATFTSPSLNANESRELADMGIPYFSEQAKDSSSNSFPDRNLPRDKRTAQPTPDPEAEGPYTQLGQRQGRKGKYNQGREFDANGQPVKDIDFTDHGRPNEHTNPHQHPFIPNPTGGTPQHGDPEPVSN